MNKEEEEELTKALMLMGRNQEKLTIIVKQMSDELYRMLKEIKALLE